VVSCVVLGLVAVWSCWGCSGSPCRGCVAVVTPCGTLQVCCFIAYPQHGRFIAQLACIRRDIQERQLPCSETGRKVHPVVCYCANHFSSLTQRLVTFSSKFSSNCSHILEVILSQTIVQTLSIVLEKIMATVVTVNQELPGQSVQQH